MFERLRRLLPKENKENDITREETVGGIKFVYHKDLDGGWVDMNRTIHLTEPERLVAFIRNHELAHYRRWNKPAMRYLRLFHKSVVGGGALVFLFVFALMLSKVLGTDIPLLIVIGLIGLVVSSYIICSAYEEHVASREAEKLCEELLDGAKKKLPGY